MGLSPLLQPLNQSCCCILPDRIPVQFHYTAITLSLLFGHYSGLFPTPYRLRIGSQQLDEPYYCIIIILQPDFKTFFFLLPSWADINKRKMVNKNWKCYTK